jgi:glycosyltransferase involved in cell wall biosynthesis
VRDGVRHTDAIEACNITTSPLQRLPGAAGSWRRQYLMLMPWAVERLKVQPCDLLISTSSAVMKSIQPPPGVPHLCYCHSPARYLWEQTEDYSVGSGGAMRSLGLRAIRRPFQEWDRRTAWRVARFVANSSHTAARIRRCFDREADVVHPPVRTDFFTPEANMQREDWLLVVAALEPYKRTDLVIEAANRAKVPLKIVGDGSQRAALQAMAGPHVQMFGRVDDEQLRSLYRRAKGLVFPQVEDFGIIAVEAQACGCPVIAYAAGGAMDIVRECSGVLFQEQTVDAIVNAIAAFRAEQFCDSACRANALRFSEDAFDDRIACIVKQMIANR